MKKNKKNNIFNQILKKSKKYKNFNHILNRDFQLYFKKKIKKI